MNSPHREFSLPVLPPEAQRAQDPHDGQAAARCEPEAPLRILFVMRDTLPPFRSDVLALFGKYLVCHGIVSDVVGQRIASSRHTLDSDESPSWPAGRTLVAGCTRSGIIGQFMVPLQDALVLARHRESFDLVQVRDKIRSAVFGWALARRHGVPFVYWMSFPMVEGFAETARLRPRAGWLLRMADAIRVSWSRRLLYRFVLNKADHVFVQSEAMRTWLAGKGMDLARMTAVPMGVDLERCRPEAVKPSTDPRLAGRRAVVYLGVVDRARDSTFLLDLMLALRERDPSILLVLAGDAPSAEEARWIRAEIDRRGLARDVLLTGWLPQEQALGYVAASVVGISPIPRGVLYDVSSPTKVLEYLALGIPAVGNDIPDQKKVLDDSGAGLCVPMNVRAFRDAVLRLLHDRQLWLRCNHRGPAYVRSERSYESIAARVATVYAAILSKSKGGGMTATKE